jgi:ATP-dependent RNA helicase DDX35
MAFEKAQRSSSWCHRNHINYQSMKQSLCIRAQLSKFLSKFKITDSTCDSDTESVRKCLLQGFFHQAAAVQPDGSYRSLRDGSAVWIHPNSVLFERVPSYVFYHELIETTRSYMNNVSVADPKWIMEAA